MIVEALDPAFFGEAAISEKVRADMETLISALAVKGEFDPKQFKVDMAPNTVIERLKSAYEL